MRWRNAALRGFLLIESGGGQRVAYVKLALLAARSAIVDMPSANALGALGANVLLVFTVTVSAVCPESSCRINSRQR